MQRIVEGNLFERRTIPGAWVVSTKRSNGVMIRSARPMRESVDLGPAPEWMLYPVDKWKPGEEEAFIEERRAKNAARNAARAKTQCRDAIIAEGCDELLTLTYRDNMEDKALTKRHFAAWCRRMKAALGGKFRYIAAPEKQERGAYHWHIATHKLPEHAAYKGVKVKAWEVGTKIWRDIVGKTADGKTNGLCFVGGKPSKWGRKRRKHMGLYKMASYVAKYILKAAEDGSADGSHRYQRSLGAPKIHAERVHLSGVELADLISVIFEQCEGSDIVSHGVGRWGDAYWLATEIPRNARLH